MLTEIEIMSSDVTKAMKIIEEEINQRIKHGDGEIAPLQRVFDALGEADRILII